MRLPSNLKPGISIGREPVARTMLSASIDDLLAGVGALALDLDGVADGEPARLPVR